MSRKKHHPFFTTSYERLATQRLYEIVNNFNKSNISSLESDISDNNQDEDSKNVFPNFRHSLNNNIFSEDNLKDISKVIYKKIHITLKTQLSNKCYWENANIEKGKKFDLHWAYKNSTNISEVINSELDMLDKMTTEMDDLVDISKEELIQLVKNVLDNPLEYLLEDSTLLALDLFAKQTKELLELTKCPMYRYIVDQKHVKESLELMDVMFRGKSGLNAIYVICALKKTNVIYPQTSVRSLVQQFPFIGKERTLYEYMSGLKNTDRVIEKFDCSEIVNRFISEIEQIKSSWETTS